ncbi:quinolinate synthase NadA [bacterium]|nr:quinolinate synthase NadA [bacterium]
MFDPEELHEKLTRADPGYYTIDVCRDIARKLDRIAELKIERNAVLLAHNYQRPEIFEVADFTGDSLGLSLQAGEVTEADVIIFCGVHFMAETSKVVSPACKVILPNLQAGCSLADMADADDVAERIDELREQYPDLGVVCYVNTTAAVKAMCDACCTSANAVDVIRSMPNETILYLPDKNMAAYAAKRIPEKKIIPWEGYCYVHHEIEPGEIIRVKNANPGMKVLVHPECRDDVIKLADAALSTSGMIEYAKQSDFDRFLAVTECGLSDLLRIQVPNKQFFRACKICRFMKMITLDNVLDSLEKLQPEITLPEDVRVGAEKAIRRMFELTSPDLIPAALKTAV